LATLAIEGDTDLSKPPPEVWAAAAVFTSATSGSRFPSRGAYSNFLTALGEKHLRPGAAGLQHTLGGQLDRITDIAVLLKAAS
jgi:hypothetical protein